MTSLSDSEDELPELGVFIRPTRPGTAKNEATSEVTSAKPQPATTSTRPIKSKAGHGPATVRRIQLGQRRVSSNALLAPWTRNQTMDVAREKRPGRKKVASQTSTEGLEPLRIDTTKPSKSKVFEQITIAEDSDDDVFLSLDESDGVPEEKVDVNKASRVSVREDSPALQDHPLDRGKSKRPVKAQESKKPLTKPSSSLKVNVSRYGRDLEKFSSDDGEQDRAETPPRSRPKTKARPAGLVSPKKLAKIPMTPHGPSSDMFWSQEFVDDWNDEHSPVKKLFQSAITDALPASPEKATVKTAKSREVKKLFDQAKHGIAEAFVRELDTAITDGKIAELAATTGGVKIVWSGKLQTTAGRATWRRESKKQRVGEAEWKVTDRHYAAIELAEKVISNEERLLNVLAHEFCHLANFMVSGVTNNPHGKTFKTWGAKCTRAFAHRGINVTTKHSYDIDFKYVFICTCCRLEFKRHSKSINVDRHRCGECKGELKQIKPAPRANGKTSEYQIFMKEQMKLIKQQNPGSSQKDIMKLVGERWSRVSKAKGDAIDSVTKGLSELVVLDD